MTDYAIEITDDMGMTWEFFPNRERRNGYSRNLILRGDNSAGGGYWASGTGNAKWQLKNMGYITANVKRMKED